MLKSEAMINWDWLLPCPLSLALLYALSFTMHLSVKLIVPTLALKTVSITQFHQCKNRHHIQPRHVCQGQHRCTQRWGSQHPPLPLQIHLGHCHSVNRLRWNPSPLSCRYMVFQSCFINIWFILTPHKLLQVCNQLRQFRSCFHSRGDATVHSKLLCDATLPLWVHSACLWTLGSSSEDATRHLKLSCMVHNGVSSTRWFSLFFCTIFLLQWSHLHDSVAKSLAWLPQHSSLLSGASFLIAFALEEALESVAACCFAVRVGNHAKMVLFLFSRLIAVCWWAEALRRLNMLNSKSPKHCSPTMFVNLDCCSLAWTSMSCTA